MELDEIATQVMRSAEKHFDDAVVLVTQTKLRTVRFANNGLSSGAISDSVYANLFAVKGKRIGEIVLTDFSPKKIEKDAVQLGKAIARSKPNPDYFGLPDTGFRKQEIQNLYDPRVEQLTDDEVAGFVEETISSALDKGAERTSGTLHVAAEKEVLRSTGGAHCSQKSTEISLIVRAFAQKNASGQKTCCARTMPHFKPKEAGEKAAELAVQSRNPVEGKAGKYDVIFDPLAAAPILEQVGNAASMYAIESGTSFFEGRLNKKVGSDIVTIFDDGKLAGGIGSTAYDEEGIPSQKTTLIRFGVLRNYLHNTSTSRKYEVQTTGNAGLICPRPWNVVMDKGTYDINELIRQTKNGLYVTNMWYFEFQNEKTGEFSAMPRDAVFKIENGEITGAVTGLRLCDTIPNILNNVDGITEKREQISSWDTEVPVKCGHILVRGMTMTKSEDTPLEGRETV